ncbi:MAG: S1C family serine protease [Saccharofermentanales bacterium]
MKKDRLGLVILIAVFLLALLLVPLSCPTQEPEETKATDSTTTSTTSRPTSPPTSPTTFSSTTSSDPGEEEPPPEEPELPEIFAQVAPSVVSVHLSIPASSLYSKREEFFSGLIVDESGIIVTSYSLMERALDFRGQLQTGASILIYVRGDTQAYPATLIGYRSTVDLALLRITEPGEKVFVAQSLARQPSLAVGTAVFSIGYPPAMVKEGGLSAGYIISLYKTSYQEDGSPVGLIETSIPTQPLYAGGPLINKEGQVVALTSGYLKRIYVQHLGYAIPSPIVSDVIRQIMATPDPAPARKASLGITVLGDEDAAFLSQQFGYPAGLYVNLVKSESAAYTAGLNADDILLDINGQAMEAVRDLMTFMDEQAVGALVEMTIFRPSTGQTLIKTCYLLEELP